MTRITEPLSCSQAPAGLVGRTVLLVDDDPRNVYAMQCILETEQVIVSVATNGQDAVDHVKAHPGTDIVLMDVMMVGMDGMEATRQIRKSGFQSLPIIGLTANAMKGDREKCLAAGFSDYMAKPIEIDAFLRMLRNWLSIGCKKPSQ